MRKWLVALALVVAAASGLGVVVRQARALPNTAQSCGDWGNATSDRVAQARELMYPKERQQKSTGSIQGDAQALYKLAQDQAGTSPPKAGQKLNGDLVEALSAGAAALGGGVGAAPDAQIAFAKAIVYNADLRIAYLLDHC